MIWVSLREIRIDDDNCPFRKVDHFLIGPEGPSLHLYTGCQRQVVIPSCVAVLKRETFAHCQFLGTVAFEGGSQLRVLDQRAFAGCPSLRSVQLPPSLEVIGKQAFDTCCSLAAVEFEAPSRLSVIDEFAFQQCNRLASITLPSSLTVVDRFAFAWCPPGSVIFESGSPSPEMDPEAFGWRGSYH